MFWLAITIYKMLKEKNPKDVFVRPLISKRFGTNSSRNCLTSSKIANNNKLPFLPTNAQTKGICQKPQAYIGVGYEMSNCKTSNHETSTQFCQKNNVK